MVNFNQFQLKNGLKCIVHEDPTANIAVCNVLYKVGSRNEQPSHTGFAHLFEHFMFEGSKNIPQYDVPLQKAGGASNAFTSSDVTNYYDYLPASNIETAFWLESDRMLSLAFNQKGLDTQISVVIEEFKENYINKPYGNAWHLLLDLAYKQHPYRWPVIGKELSHIEQITMGQVKAFFNTYYRPNNAILSVAGNVKTSEIEKLANKWFGNIPSSDYTANIFLTPEPKQTEKRTLETEAKVPVNAIYKTYQMDNRLSKNYYSTDLLSDILGTGESAYLYQKLVKEHQIFTDIDCYISGSIDNGLLFIEGKVNQNIDIKDAEKTLNKTLNTFKAKAINEQTLEKVKNKVITQNEFSDASNMNKAFSLALYDYLGDVNLINTEIKQYEAVTAEQVFNTAQQVLKEEQSCTLFYNKQA